MFKQGNIDLINSVLDLVINGNGFFVISNNGVISYICVGYFNIDKQDFIVDNNGYCLQGYVVGLNGQLQNGVVIDFKVECVNQVLQVILSIQQLYNFNLMLKLLIVMLFDLFDVVIYNLFFLLGIYDSQGNFYIMSQFFIKNELDLNVILLILENSWIMKVLIDGVNLFDLLNKMLMSFNVIFDVSGQMILVWVLDGSISGLGFSIDVIINVIQFSLVIGNLLIFGIGWILVVLDGKILLIYVWNGVIGVVSGIFFDMCKIIQYFIVFVQSNLIQDGYIIGQLVGLEIDDIGVIFVCYINGQFKVQGQVVLVNFVNIQGLMLIGKIFWVQFLEFGELVVGVLCLGILGVL